MNIGEYRVHPDTRVRIECAIARGWKLDFIVDQLNVTTRDVDFTLAWMDACNKPDVEPLPCGTHAAYTRHRSRHEPVDEACRAGEAEYQAAQYEQRTVGQRRVVEPCGTHAAFNRHRKRGEPVDDLCLTAERIYQTARGRAKRQRQRRGAGGGGVAA